MMDNPGVIPVQERHRFDPARLEAWLRDHVAGYQGPLAIEQFGGGQSNPTYRLTAPSGRYVLRRKPPGKLLASAHAVDREYRVIGLESFGRPGNYLQRQIERWSKQYRLSETERIEAMDNLIAWLPQNIPTEDATSIVHGDYRMDNMIFAADAPRILAVIDWELSTLGNPLADFAYHVMYWRLEPALFRGLAGTDFAASGIPSEAEYVAAYCRRTGRDGIAHWDTYIAYNMFRLAGILQGIMKRFLDGTAASKQAEQSGRRTRGIAEAGWRQVEAMLKRQ